MARRMLTRTAQRIPWRIGSVLWLLLFTVGPGMAFGTEPGEQPEYVRTVGASPTLAEMEKGEGWSYNAEYLYALTRGVRDSSLSAGAKVVVFVPAFVVDTAFLPVALIFGLFG